MHSVIIWLSVSCVSLMHINANFIPITSDSEDGFECACKGLHVDCLFLPGTPRGQPNKILYQKITSNQMLQILSNGNIKFGKFLVCVSILHT